MLITGFRPLPSGSYAWRAWLSDGGVVGAPRGHLEVSVGNEHMSGGSWAVYLSFDPASLLWRVPGTLREGWATAELPEAFSLGVKTVRGRDLDALLEALSDPLGLLSVLEVMGS